MKQIEEQVGDTSLMQIQLENGGCWERQTLTGSINQSMKVVLLADENMSVTDWRVVLV